MHHQRCLGSTLQHSLQQVGFVWCPPALLRGRSVGPAVTARVLNKTVPTTASSDQDAIDVPARHPTAEDSIVGDARATTHLSTITTSTLDLPDAAEHSTTSSTDSETHSNGSTTEDAWVNAPALPSNVWTDDILPRNKAQNGGSSSSSTVDEEDRPESLADVELTSVAPGEQWFTESDDVLTITTAIAVGVVVAASVFSFDVAIQFVHDLPDIFSTQLGIGGGRATGFTIGDVAVPFRCIMPIGAGIIVAGLQAQGFSPPLKYLTRAIEGVVDDRKSYDTPKSYGPIWRKAMASAITLGSGASLGPEAPSVELGANMAAVLAPKQLSKRRQRMLVAAGAAAGVTAAFDAPVAGALFAIEFVLKSSRLGLDRLSTSTVFVAASVAAGLESFLRYEGQALGIKGAASHLVGRIPYFSINSSLIIDVLQFSALGLGCAGAAVLLYEGVRISELFLRPLPRIVSAPLAGAACGAIALSFPSVQYGYINLEEIFRDSTHMPVNSLLGLLFAKVAATAVCVGGGLVGGLFAPSLFLGALVGDIMGHLTGPASGLVVDKTTYIVVGAAAVLGAACRAPLTAMALMVEITRDTGLLVPLLAAIGISSLVTDYVEGAFSRKFESLLVEMYLKEKALFWGAAAAEQLIAAESGKDNSNIVSSVMSTNTNLYVRHTLPLEQARTAMKSHNTNAAVVVDDNSKVVGVVYLPEVEDEIVRRREMNAPDSNFNRPT